jgi:hypothetical protein
MSHSTLSPDFSKIRQKLGFPLEEPLETLLARVTQKVSEEPDNLELAYLHAEILRKLQRGQEAEQTYQQVTHLAAEKTDHRHAGLVARLQKTHQHLQIKLGLVVAVLIGGLLLTITMFVKELLQIETLENPTQLAFVKWLADRQLLEIVAKVKEEYPDKIINVKSGQHSEDPWDSLVVLMDPSKLPSEARIAGIISSFPVDDSENDDVPPLVPFQCSSLAKMSCNAQDTPSAGGEVRENIFRMVNTYAFMLSGEKNCEDLATLINWYSEKLTWRQEEAFLKARLEDMASGCYLDEKNLTKARQHINRIICSGTNDSSITKAYLWSAQIAFQENNHRLVQTMLNVCRRI